DGPTVFAHVCKMGLDSIVSKRMDSRYTSGRSADWLKSKNPASEAVLREAEEDWGDRRRKAVLPRWARPRARDGLRLDVSLLYGVEVEHLRYPLGALSPGTPHSAAIPTQENSFHLHMGTAGLQSDDAAYSDFAAH